MIEFELLVRGCYRPKQLVIDYDPLLRMSIPLEMQAAIDDLWQKKMTVAQEKGLLLFDGQLFRLVNAEACADGTLHIVLGDTGYKEYIGTRTAEFVQGRGRYELSNPLAVCSVIETSDDFILLEKRRSGHVYEGRYHVIGGFCERNMDMTKQRPDAFAAIRREIREETGIQEVDIREQYCLGLAYDLVTPHPELCFLTRLNIPLDEVMKREPEEDEIQQLLSLHVTSESLKEFIVSNSGNISATGEPNLLLYGGLRFGEGWYEDVMEYIKR